MIVDEESVKRLEQAVDDGEFNHVTGQPYVDGIKDMLEFIRGNVTVDEMVEG
jgi:hypothetical protein